MVSSSGAASHLLATDPLSSPVLHRLLRDETAVFYTQSASGKSNSSIKRSWGVIQHTRCARSKSGPRRSQSRLSLANAQLCGDPRDRHGSVREELATRVEASYGLSKRRPTAFERPSRARPTSYATNWSATSIFMPAASTSWTWTKTSGPPSSGAIKPYPRSVLKNLTRPVGMPMKSDSTHSKRPYPPRRRATAAGRAGHNALLEGVSWDRIFWERQ